MKSTFYFSHDQNARSDEKIIPLLRAHGWLGYGLFWALVEKLWEEHGSIKGDFEMLAFDLRTEAKLIESIVNDFDLFYTRNGRVRSRSVDRRIDERSQRVESARQAGIKSGRARVERSLNGRSTDPELERNKEKKEIKQITTATPSAVDSLIEEIKTDVPKGYDTWRFPRGFNAKYAGAYIINIPVDECVVLLNTPRLGNDIKAALKWRIEMKRRECAK